VICLQEVARGFDSLPGLQGEDQVAQFAALFPDHQAVYAPGTDRLRHDGARMQFGNLTLSRRPVLAAWRHLLPWPADASVPSMQRACAEAVIETAPGVCLRVLNTHLEYYSPTQRMTQIDALRTLNAEALGHARNPTGRAGIQPGVRAGSPPGGRPAVRRFQLRTAQHGNPVAAGEGRRPGSDLVRHPDASSSGRRSSGHGRAARLRMAGSRVLL
jgi:endonuclease/exonuclease/phosphatase family metal-dependent hydrolase